MRRGERPFSVGNELGSLCFCAEEAHGGPFHGGAAGRTLAVLSADHLLVNVTDLMEPYYLHVPIAGGYMGSSSSAPSAWRPRGLGIGKVLVSGVRPFETP